MRAGSPRPQGDDNGKCGRDVRAPEDYPIMYPGDSIAGIVGVFRIVHNGSLLNYYYVGKKAFTKLIQGLVHQS